MRERTVYDKRDIKKIGKTVCDVVLAGAVIGGSYKIGKLVGINKACTWIGNGLYKVIKTVKLEDGTIVGTDEFMQELCKAIKEL